MLWFLLIISIFGTLIFLFKIVSELFFSDREWSNIRRWSIKLLICIVLGAIGFLGLYGINCLSYVEVSETNNSELASITDNSQLYGNGSGGLFYVHTSINTNDVYSFYYKVDIDGFKKGKIDADITTIYEKDDCTPHIVEYTTYTKNKMNSILRIILAFGYGESSQKNYEIYTPKGTILKTFDLDSQ